MRQIKAILKKDWLGFLALPLIILALNVFLVLPLFQGEYTQFISSIESAFVAQGKFIVENFPHLSWNPLWYAGFPFHLFYTPLPATFEVLLSFLPGISLPQAYRILSALTYSLVPVSLYVVVRALGKGKIAAFFSAYFLTVAPSLSYLLYANVRADALRFNLAPWRFVILVLFGEGPHTLSMFFLPLAAGAFIKALEKKSLLFIFLSALAISLTALANPFGMIALAFLLAIIALVCWAAEKKTEVLLITFRVALLSSGLLAFWYNLSFFQSLFAFSGAKGETFLYNAGGLVPILLLSIPLIVFVVSYLLRSVSRRRAFSIIALWTSLLLAITIAWFNFKVAFVPQGIRYLPELDMGIAMMFGLAIETLADKVERKFNRIGAWLLLGLILVIVSLCTSWFWLHSWQFLTPHPDIKKTAEYEIANWLESQAGEERVYLTGNYAFWLNVITDVPQLRGGSDQGATNPWWDHVTYQINAGEDPEIAIAWLKAMNLSYIVVNFGNSPNYYKDYKVPRKFEGRLEKVYENHGDAIYQVPIKNLSLVKPADFDVLPNLRTPYNALDKEALLAYVDWIEKPSNSTVRLTKIRSNRYEVVADLKKENEGILLQVTADPGWKAKLAGKKLGIEEDPLGFMILRPGLGKKKIILSHGPAWDEWLGYGITLVTLICLITIALKRGKG